jgi:hypothetical protein
MNLALAAILIGGGGEVIGGFSRFGGVLMFPLLYHVP